LPENLFSLHLTSTVGGTDYYLREIRNVIKTKEDVASYWPFRAPEDTKILTLDLGQAFVVGASAIIPQSACPTSDRKGKTPLRTITVATTSSSSSITASSRYRMDFWKKKLNVRGHTGVDLGVVGHLSWLSDGIV